MAAFRLFPSAKWNANDGATKLVRWSGSSITECGKLIGDIRSVIFNEIESDSCTTFDESVVRAESNEIFSRENGWRVSPSIDLRLGVNVEWIYSIESRPKLSGGQFVVPFEAPAQVLQGNEVVFGEYSVVVNA